MELQKRIQFTFYLCLIPQVALMGILLFDISRNTHINQIEPFMVLPLMTMGVLALIAMCDRKASSVRYWYLESIIGFLGVVTGVICTFLALYT